MKTTADNIPLVECDILCCPKCGRPIVVVIDGLVSMWCGCKPDNPELKPTDCLSSQAAAALRK